MQNDVILNIVNCFNLSAMLKHTILFIKTKVVLQTDFDFIMNCDTIFSCRYLNPLLYKQDPATEFTKLGSTPFKYGATLVPKLTDLLSFWRSGSAPFKYWIKYSWSGLTHQGILKGEVSLYH